ncbi:hypothetical protein BH23CHL2_BH23CHL2_15900 [soil metagenome]
MSVDYLDIAQRAIERHQRQTGSEKSEITSPEGKRDSGSQGEISEQSEISLRLRDIGPQLWPIPEEPDIVSETRQMLDDGTLARIGQGRTFRYSSGLWCVNLPEFARRLIDRIDRKDEGPHTWQRLTLAYWTVRCWLEDERRLRF